MTVNTLNITSGPYSGNDVADQFSYTFRIEEKDQLRVFETNASGDTTELTVDTDYTVAGIGDDGGGTLTRSSGPLPSGFTWFIRSNYIPTQDVAFGSQGGFFPEVHEGAFDKTTFLIQQLYDLNNRNLKISPSEPLGANLEIPNAADRASKVLTFGLDGGVEVEETPTDLLLRQELADSVDPTKGAAIVGYSEDEANAIARNVYLKMQESAVTPQDFFSGDWFAAINFAKAFAETTGRVLKFPKQIYNIGGNELVFNTGGMQIWFDNGAEIRSSANYPVTFAATGGTAQPVGNNPTSQIVVGLNVRTISPFGASSDRTAIRVSSSYSLFFGIGAVTSADPGGNGISLLSDNTGTGPYYTTLYQPKAQGKQDGTATGKGIFMTQRAGTTPVTRYPNACTVIGGRVGGYLVNWELVGNGNALHSPTSESVGNYGSAFKWRNSGANTNVTNRVHSPYIENANIALEVDSGVAAPSVSDPYITGAASVVSDPGGHLMISGGAGDGVRQLRLARVPNTNAPRSGAYFGNTANPDPETLDWYQEGTWTPTLVGATTSGDYTLTVAGANYTRIGNKVHVDARFTITINSAGTGTARFGGLPFPKGSNKFIGGSVSLTNVTLHPDARGVALGTWTVSSDSTYVIQSLRSGSNPVNVDCADVLAGATVTVSLEYLV